LVGQEVDETGHAGAGALGQPEQHEWDAAGRPPDLGHEVGHAHPGPRQRGEGHAEHQPGDGRGHAGDPGDEHRPGEVLADHPVGEATDAVGLAAPADRDEAAGPAQQVLPVQQEGDGHQDGGDGGQQAAEQ
jgi:hypothetical protein